MTNPHPSTTGRPWPKGTSGNPKGRPKVKSFKQLLQEVPEEDKSALVRGMYDIAMKGRHGDRIRAAEWIAKHGDDQTAVTVESEDFTITIAPSSAMIDAAEEEDD